MVEGFICFREEDKKSSNFPAMNEKIIEVVRAIHDYNSTESACISFRKGETLRVYERHESGWWDGVNSKHKRGWFPSNFVERIDTSGPSPSRRVSSRENMYQSGSSLTQEEEEEQLPRFWGKKVTKEGQVYYYNSNTNETTFSLSQVMSGNIRDHAAQPRASTTSSREDNNWMPQSLLSRNSHLSWELLINNILRAISDLNQAAKQDVKAEYILKTNRIVIAIRDMLSSSGCISRENYILKENKVLRSHHHQIMGSLSKLVLTSKVASGVWPPPDAVNKMRFCYNI